MNKNIVIVSRTDFDAALARIEYGEAQKADCNLVRAYVDRLEACVRSDCLESNTEAILYSELVREA